MGYRANFVLADEHGWRLHYSRTGARSVCSLLARGPLAARRAIASLPRVEDRQRHWYSDSFAEGGAVLDFARRRLLFYGDDGGAWEPAETRVFRELLRRVWRDWGWRVRWAYDGQGDLVAAAGLSRTLVRSRSTHTLQDEVEADLSDPVHLLTVRGADGALRAWPLGWDEPAGWHGAGLLDRLPHGGTDHLELGAIPHGGTHVDVPERTVGVWTGSTCEGLLPALAGLWPGWRTEFWGDRYEQHLLVCDGAVAVPAFDAHAALDRVLEHLPAGRRTRMRAGIDRALGDAQNPGYVGRRTPRADADEEEAPSEDEDWFWAGRAAGYLRRDLRHGHTEPGTPPWMRQARPAPDLPDFLRARIDEQQEAVTGLARLENNLRGYQYWFRTAAMSPPPEYDEEVGYWPDWKVVMGRDDRHPGGPFPSGALVSLGYFLHLETHTPLAGSAPITATEAARRDAELAGTHLARHSPARAREDIDARRRLLDRYTRAVADVERLRREGAPAAAVTAARAHRYTLFLALRELAAAYVHHRDHNPEWALPAGSPYRP